MTKKQQFLRDAVQYAVTQMTEETTLTDCEDSMFTLCLAANLVDVTDDAYDMLVNVARGVHRKAWQIKSLNKALKYVEFSDLFLAECYEVPNFRPFLNNCFS